MVPLYHVSRSLFNFSMISCWSAFLSTFCSPAMGNRLNSSSLSGSLYKAMDLVFKKATISSSVNRSPGFGTTWAQHRSPIIGSGMPTMATSEMLG